MKKHFLDIAIKTYNPDIPRMFDDCRCDYEDFLSAISKSKYCLPEEIGYSPKGATKLTKRLFPNKSGSEKICTWLLAQIGLKHCSKCSSVLPLEDFADNTSRAGNKNGYCKPCHYSQTYSTQVHRTAKYKSARLQRIPIWADIKEISRIYADCPKDWHVDHIVPLQGSNVCGLHVQNNLQYLTKEDNIKKSNTF